MPMSDTMQGCCRACSMLASCRNSEKFFMASVARRCLSMVSAGRAWPSVLPGDPLLGRSGGGPATRRAAPRGLEGLRGGRI